jgi:hypothetical protein
MLLSQLPTDETRSVKRHGRFQKYPDAALSRLNQDDQFTGLALEKTMCETLSSRCRPNSIFELTPMAQVHFMHFKCISRSSVIILA